MQDFHVYVFRFGAIHRIDEHVLTASWVLDPDTEANIPVWLAMSNAFDAVTRCPLWDSLATKNIF